MNTTLTALKGVAVGHATDNDKLTGCTVILFDRDLPVAYTSNGGGSATFNTDMNRNGKSFHRRHGLFVAGGSMQGLMSATPIMQKMIKNKLGFPNGNVINPSLSGAIIFDLGMFIDQYNPLLGEKAFENLNDKPVERGNVGAGTGATVGKFAYGKDMKMFAMKAGVGCARKDLGNGIIITALSIVNAVGNIVNKDGTILAGNRDEKNGFQTFEEVSHIHTQSQSNTTISIVGLNVDLKTRENYEKVSQMASQGQVRAISPVNLSIDGDTVFVFSNEELKSFLSPTGKQLEQTYMLHNIAVDIIGHAAANAVQESIYDACHQAESIEFKNAFNRIIPSISDYPKR